MKAIFLLIVSCGLVLNIAAQTPEDSVKQTVNKLFTALKAGDSTMILASFANSAILQTIVTTKEAKVLIRNEALTEFAHFVTMLPKGSADERITFETVKIDGDLAIVWTPYNFYLNGKFSHCGVNSFQLVRLGGSWKIQYLIDTRRKTGCNL